MKELFEIYDKFEQYAKCKNIKSSSLLLEFNKLLSLLKSENGSKLYLQCDFIFDSAAAIIKSLLNEKIFSIEEVQSYLEDFEALRNKFLIHELTSRKKEDNESQFDYEKQQFHRALSCKVDRKTRLHYLIIHFSNAFELIMPNHLEIFKEHKRDFNRMASLLLGFIKQMPKEDQGQAQTLIEIYNDFERQYQQDHFDEEPVNQIFDTLIKNYSLLIMRDPKNLAFKQNINNPNENPQLELDIDIPEETYLSYLDNINEAFLELIEILEETWSGDLYFEQYCDTYKNAYMAVVNLYDTLKPLNKYGEWRKRLNRLNLLIDRYNGRSGIIKRFQEKNKKYKLNQNTLF